VEVKLNFFEIIQNLLENINMTIEEQEKYVYSRLRQEREHRGISQLELSYSSGVSQNMITYIETGKRTPTLTTIFKLCNAMNLDVSSIFPGNEAEKEKAKQTVIDLVKKYM